LEDAAEAVYQFLKLGSKSNFRMAVSILSCGGVFWGTEALDKTARSWLQEKHIGSDEFHNVCKARVGNADTPNEGHALGREMASGSLFES